MSMHVLLKRKRLIQACMVACVVGLSGCASKSYVVLLPDEDGSVGKVVVNNAQGTTVLQAPREGAQLGGAAGKTFVVEQAQIDRDFGVALAASPRKPATYLLYFETGGAALTAVSQADLPRIRDDIKGRPAPDISVIGHTDTAGDAEANYKLGLKRAQQVVDLLGKTNLSPERITVDSHGERNLLVKTPDGIDEPRNRRVEVNVR
ncbi:MAG: OmpA family protein [Rhodocyclales bacterium GT-UBC]|nr:MAG: OmpA family protein [Rhodocyclales bacterium GT-UBC]